MKMGKKKGFLFGCLFLFLTGVLFLEISSVGEAKTIDNVKLGKKYTMDTSAKKEDIFQVTLDKKRELSLVVKMSGKQKTQGDCLQVSFTNAAGNVVYMNQAQVLPKGSVEQNFVLEPGTYSVKVKANCKGYKYSLKIKDVTKYPTKIKIKKKLKLKVGRSHTLKITVVKPKAVYVPLDTLSFASTNKKVATVDGNGKIKAKNPGSCKITVTLKNGKVYSCAVTVPKKKLEDNILNDKIAVAIKEFWIDGDNHQANLIFINRYKKKHTKSIVFVIYQYDEKGKRLKTGTNVYKKNYLNNMVKGNTYATYQYKLNSKTQYIRTCIKSATLTSGKVWKSKYFTKWQKKYKKSYK